ncbi:MAG: type II secretion system minor pseudopilin GspK [Burkholderiaceae bacterium]
MSGARSRQRGAAVLLALFIATLATLIVTGLFYRQFVLLRTIENEQLAAQSRVLLRGALDWSRAILRGNTENKSVMFDALTEPWAQPLADMRLDTLGESSALAAKASLSGNIEDAEGRFNLRNLVDHGKPVEREIEALRRLATLLQAPPATADLIAARMVEALPPPAAKPDTSRPLPLLLPDDIVGIPGISPDAAQKLAPYVVVLEARTPINVNTAPAEVIAARLEGLDLVRARALVAQRDRIGHFNSLGDVRNYAGNIEIDERDVAIQSSHFIVRGQVRLDRAITRMEALVKREANNIARVLWQRELP